MNLASLNIYIEKHIVLPGSTSEYTDTVNIGLFILVVSQRPLPFDGFKKDVKCLPQQCQLFRPSWCPLRYHWLSSSLKLEIHLLKKQFYWSDCLLESVTKRQFWCWELEPRSTGRSHRKSLFFTRPWVLICGPVWLCWLYKAGGVSNMLLTFGDVPLITSRLPTSGSVRQNISILIWCWINFVGFILNFASCKQFRRKFIDWKWSKIWNKLTNTSIVF